MRLCIQQKFFLGIWFREMYWRLGPAEGVMTEFLVKNYDDITVVEGSKTFSDNLKSTFPKITVVNKLFEEFDTNRKFDNIILGHVLEHVDNSHDILSKCKQWLKEGGVIIGAVPNSNSIHRQAAVEMGLLDNTKQLNETDIFIGHRRVYDLETLKKDFEDSGFNIIKLGGYWFKPISNKQINESWTEEMIMAFMSLGEKYPEIAGEIYIVASKGE